MIQLSLLATTVKYKLYRSNNRSQALKIIKFFETNVNQLSKPPWGRVKAIKLRQNA